MEYSWAIGWCQNENCPTQYGKTFLIDPKPPIRCKICKASISFVQPQFTIEGDDLSLFKTIELEYKFNPITREYTEKAILTDESLKHGSIFRIQNPSVMTEKRAFRIAEGLLSSLNYYDGLSNLDANGVPKWMERTIDFDSPTYKNELNSIFNEVINKNVSLFIY